MQDKLLIATRIKKTITYIDGATINFPHVERFLRNKIIGACYELLESVYSANVYKDDDHKKEILVKVKMVEYYVKTSLDKELISYKKFEVIGRNLLEINNMIKAWLKNEKSK